jgi:hypothetical protein
MQSNRQMQTAKREVFYFEIKVDPEKKSMILHSFPKNSVNLKGN